MKTRVSSLKMVLIVPYVALVLGLALVIGLLSYVAGSRAVDTVSNHLLIETVQRIGQAVDRHVVGSGATLEAAFPNGMPAPADIGPEVAKLRTRFWIATSLHIDPNNYVYYGNRAGQAMGLYRFSYEDAELRLKLRPEEFRNRYRFHGIDGELEFMSKETKLFDPRHRPWYQAGKTAGSDTWTSVYIDFNTNELVATRARRVLGITGEVEGVVATDISLKALNDFVRNLKVSPHGLAFIIDPGGLLIASSASANTRKQPDGTSIRVSAADSDNPLVSAIYAQVRDRLTSDPIPMLPQTFHFDSEDGQAIYAAFERVKDNAGLEWITVVALPRQDFMAGVTENVVRTVLAGVVASIIAVVIGLRILNWVTGDLRRLTLAARDVGEGDFNSPIAIKRTDELGELARSFETMRQRLQTDRLTGLINRTAFGQLVNARIKLQKQRGGAGFAILFIDLNGFKSINDRYGHHNGDRVLIEIAQRLRDNMRKEDTVCRYAGDEFVVMLEGVNCKRDVTPIRRHIESVLQQPLFADKDEGGMLAELSIGGAIGEAYYPDDGEDDASLLKTADRNMYQHKFSTRERRGTDHRAGA